MMFWRGNILVLFLAAHCVLGLRAQQPRALTSKEWNTRGIELSRAGDQDEAVNAFSQAIKLGPDQAGVYLNRAIAYIQLEDWEKAIADCTSVIELDPENARGFHHRALAESQRGNHEAAFKDASRAVRMEPTDPNVVFTRYLACSRLGRHELGHFAGEIYIGLQSWSDPWSPYLALLNNVSLRRAGYEEEARSILDETAQWLSQDQWPMPVVIYMRGDMEARALLERAKTKDTQTIVHYYIGANQWLAGNADSAKKHFEWVRDNGNEQFLQFMLAKDHLKELAANGVK